MLLKVFIEDMLIHYTPQRVKTGNLAGRKFRSFLIYINGDWKVKYLVLLCSGPGSKCACDRCLIEGISQSYMNSKKKSSAVKYYSVKQDFEQLRDHNEWVQCAAKADEAKLNKYTRMREQGKTRAQILQNKTYNGLHEKGIKGTSCVLLLPYVRMDQICFTQLMHCVYEKYV